MANQAPRPELMDAKSRDLVLASEISALLHDLGKLRPEFAREFFKGGTRIRECEKLGLNSAHGAILEKDRPYPEDSEVNSWLQDIKSHEGWKSVLAIPPAWLSNGKAEIVQARGLGDPLREHHGNDNFLEFTLLGTLFQLGADFRDSALDKSGESKGSGLQREGHAYIADAFGNEDVPYSPEQLDKCWQQAAAVIKASLLDDGQKPWNHVVDARRRLLAEIAPVFEQALGVTLRPTNDVTLWHHAYSTASLHKAVVAEGVLRQDFKRWQDSDGLVLEQLGLIRFRLLGIRWDWAQLVHSALEPVVFASLASRRAVALAALKQLLEEHFPVGNAVYADDDGAVFVVPGFYNGDRENARQESDRLFMEKIVRPILPALDSCLLPLGAGSGFRVAWTEPRLYLTDYQEVMPSKSQGRRELMLQVDEAGFRQLWSAGGAVCPGCGLRPGAQAELGIRDAGLKGTRKQYCMTCADLAGEKLAARYQAAQSLLGLRPRTFNFNDIRQERNSIDNPRIALLSVQIDPVAFATGTTLATQVARPLQDIAASPRVKMPQLGAGELSDFFGAALSQLDNSTLPKNIEQLQGLIGDGHWTSKKDGRITEGSTADKARKLVDEFFLREHVPSELVRPDCEIADCLTMFAMRKHASPGRLKRTWDALEQTWRSILASVGDLTEGFAAPLTLDLRGLRVVLAADDLRDVLSGVREQLAQRFTRLQGRIPVHISVVVFRETFPLYVAIDAVRRMEKRIGATPPEIWTLQKKNEVQNNALTLEWVSGAGRTTSWTVPLACGDPEVPDLWYPHLICLSRPPGPERLVHMTELEVEDQVLVQPMTFDFAVLDSTVRRYQIRYDEQGFRPHHILGEHGRRPYHLDDLDDLLNLASATGWTSSQSKAVIGQIIECYEKWVRDAPEPLREKGREAWLLHSAELLCHALPGKAAVLSQLSARLEHGMLFDTFEWNEFVEKNQKSDMGRDARRTEQENSHA